MDRWQTHRVPAMSLDRDGRIALRHPGRNPLPTCRKTGHDGPLLLVPGFLNFEMAPPTANTVVDMDKFRRPTTTAALAAVRCESESTGSGGLRQGRARHHQPVCQHQRTRHSLRRWADSMPPAQCPAVNMGQYSHVLGFAPSRPDLGVNVTSHVQLTMGYSFLTEQRGARPPRSQRGRPTQIPTAGVAGPFGPPPPFSSCPEL